MRTLKSLLLIGLLLPLGPACAAQENPQDIPKIEKLPFDLGELDSSVIGKREHPFLTSTTKEIAAARARAQGSDFGRDILEKLVKDAEAEMKKERKPLDTKWWEEAKGKNWGETYPVVFQNTWIDPFQYAHGASSLAVAWSLTSEQKYADKAKELLMVVEPYTFEYEHYDVGMNYSVWGVRALNAYDLMFDLFTKEERRRLDAFFTRLAWAVLRNDIYWVDNDIGGGVNNHLAWHKMTSGMLGLFYDRKEMVEYALNGRGRRGMLQLLADGLLDDGLWCESSLNYQFAAIVPMAILAETQHRLGDPRCLCHITAANGRTLKQSYEGMIGVLSPDGLIPPIGDAYGYHRKLQDLAVYENAWNLWQDQKFAWLIKRAKQRPITALYVPDLPAEVETPEIGTRLYPEHGYAFLRSHRDGEYWDNPDARCAFLTYDRSGVHCNQDKLSLMLFGQGEMLISDVEGRATVAHAFSSEIQRTLNRSTISQNTVMIDNADQRGTGDLLTLVEFHDLDDEKRVTAADFKGALYEGVKQMRTVCLTPEYVLDVFQVDCGDRPRQIDWIVHLLDANAHMVDPPKMEKFAFPKNPPWSWMRMPQSFVFRNLSMEWRKKDVRLRLRMVDPGAERAITCGYPASDQLMSGNIPMLMVRKRDKQAVFAAVWLVGEKPVGAAIRPVETPEKGRLVYEVQTDSTKRTHIIPKLFK